MFIAHMLILIPNELAHIIEQSPFGRRLPNGRKIGILLYADNIVLIAPTENQMQMLCKIVEKWLSDFRLKINADKSGIVSMGQVVNRK